MSTRPELAAQKRTYRTDLRTRRAALTAEQRASAAQAITEVVAAMPLGPVVAAYVPVGTEPGSIDMLAALTDRGTQVLLPVTPPDPGPLDWVVYTGELSTGRFGLAEPVGPPLGADALAGASTVLLPALAVDRAGVRLGRGAGFYDRSLRANATHARLVAVVYSHEVLDRLPAESTDVPVHAALTPAGLVNLGGAGR